MMSSAPTGDGANQELSFDDALVGLVMTVRLRVWRIGAVALGLGLLLVVHGWRKPSLYPATGGFVAEAPPPSGAAALPVGITLRTDPITSPFLYTQLLSSNGFLLRVVDHPIIRRGNDSLSWREIVTGPEGSIALRRQLSAEALRRSLDYRVALQSGVVTLTVRTGDSAVSGGMLRKLLTELARFGAEVRRQRGQDAVAALDLQLSQSTAELRNAEQRLVDHRARNRDVTKSAALSMERQRLDREMALKRQRYLTLARQHANAQATALKNDPGVIVVNDPVTSALPEPKGLVLRFLMGVIAGAGLAAVATLAFDRSAAAAALRA